MTGKRFQSLSLFSRFISSNCEKEAEKWLPLNRIEISLSPVRNLHREFRSKEEEFLFSLNSNGIKMTVSRITLVLMIIRL